MLTFIQLIIEPIMKSLSITNRLEAQKLKNAHDIGSELFFLYTILNDILVLDKLIFNDLESGLPWMERKIAEGKPDECLFGQANFQLSQQSLNILKFIASVKRLGLKLHLITPNDYVKLSPLIHGKHNAATRLRDAISGEWKKPRLVSINLNQLQKLLDQVPTLPSDYNNLRFEQEVSMIALQMHRRDPRAFLELWVHVEIDNVGHMPAKLYPVIRSYLDERKQGTEWDEIESDLRTLHETIVNNFSLQDILIDIGDRRSTLANPYVGF